MRWLMWVLRLSQIKMTGAVSWLCAAVTSSGVVGFGQGAALARAAAVNADPVEQAAARAWLEAGQPGHRQPPGALAGYRDHGGLPAAGPGAGPGRPQGLAGLILKADPRPGRRR